MKEAGNRRQEAGGRKRARLPPHSIVVGHFLILQRHSPDLVILSDQRERRIS